MRCKNLIYWAVKHPKHGLLPCSLREDREDSKESYLEFRIDAGVGEASWNQLGKRGYSLIQVSVDEVEEQKILGE